MLSVYVGVKNRKFNYTYVVAFNFRGLGILCKIHFIYILVTYEIYIKQ